jgi:hypothetical protein
MSGEVAQARHLNHEKAELRNAELAAAERHFERLRKGRPESIESTSLHLDVCATSSVFTRTSVQLLIVSSRPPERWPRPTPPRATRSHSRCRALIRRQCRQRVVISLCPPVFDPDVATFRVACPYPCKDTFRNPTTGIAGVAREPQAAMQRCRASLRIFVVRCSLPCDPPLGDHSCNGGMYHVSIAQSVTKADRQVG